MRILVADIGGTSSRFAVAEMCDPYSVELQDVEVINTAQEHISGAKDLIQEYLRSISTDLSAFDLVSLAVAGDVRGQTAILPNISWDIDLGDWNEPRRLLLLNDFQAQANSFSVRCNWQRLKKIRAGAIQSSDSVVLVGAGTGLGHALIVWSQRTDSDNPGAIIIGSEQGHANFPFLGVEEQQLELFMLRKLGIPYLTYDDVVSGGGAVCIHEFLTGNNAEPSKIFGNSQENARTIEVFSRFYGRACRNYCLAVGCFGAMIISGGIAIKNPHVIEGESFLKEFSNSTDFEPRLRDVSIFLNVDEYAGLRGAAIFGFPR